MGSGQFARQSETAARRQWWQMTKYRIFIALTAIFLIACFVCTLNLIMSPFCMIYSGSIFLELAGQASQKGGRKLLHAPRA